MGYKLDLKIVHRARICIGSSCYYGDATNVSCWICLGTAVPFGTVVPNFQNNQAHAQCSLRAVILALAVTARIGSANKEAAMLPIVI